MIARHIMFTSSAHAKRILATLADQPFVKVMPKDYKRVMRAEAKARAENRNLNSRARRRWLTGDEEARIFKRNSFSDILVF